MTIRAIFPGRALARISILPKIYLKHIFWLCLRVQTDRCITWKYHTDGSLCFQSALDVKHWSSEPRRFKSNTPKMYAYLHRFDRRSHLLTHHDWSIMYNACMLLVKLLFDHYLQQVWKQENKAKTNPGMDVSGKNGTYGHPNLYLHKRHISNGPNNTWPGPCISFVKFTGIKIYFI